MARHFVRLYRHAVNHFRERVGARLHTIILSCFASRPGTDYRRTFKDMDIDKKLKHADMRGHSHRAAASLRCFANTFINTFILSTGRSVHSVSLADSEAGRVDGDRYYYVAKDLQTLPSYVTPKPGSVLKLTDVDYYCDMPQLLTGDDVLLYTFVPSKAAGLTQDAVYTILPDDRVRVTVNGGATYEHPLWNYDVDHVIVDHWWGSVMYLVEQRETDHVDRRIVYFNAIRKVYGPFAWWLPGDRLAKRTFNIGGGVGHVRVQRQIPKGSDMEMVHYHSFARHFGFSSVEIPDHALQTVVIRLNNAKEPAISDVERILRASDVGNPAFGASVLFQAFKDGSQLLGHENKLTSACIHLTKQSLKTDMWDSYQTLHPLVTEDGGPGGRRILSPLLDECVFPARGYNNDNACIDGRIRRVANNTDTYPPFYLNCMNEFIQLLVPSDIARSFAPGNFDHQYAQFDRRSQRGFVHAMKHMFHFDTIWTIKSFQKKEAYAKITDPRNISTLPMDHNFRLGQYTTIAAEILKRQEWYAFGHHPREITLRLRKVCDRTSKLTVADISKCDGSTGYFSYLLISGVLTRVFANEYHEEILGLLRKEAFARGYTANDLSYETMYNTLSGSSMTSIRNSLVNAYVNYVALRSTMDPKEAYANLGLYGGDDGVSACVSDTALAGVFAKFGMLAKAETVLRGDPVGFLGRLYLDPWTTDESVIDVARHVRKLHLTVTPKEVPDNLVLWRKAEGFAITDPTTPLICDWVRFVMKYVPPPTVAERKRWSSYTNHDVTYWSRYEAPFPPVVNQDLARDVIIRNLDVDEVRYDWLVCCLRNATSIEEYNDIAALTPKPKVEIAAAYRGVVVVPGAPREDHQEVVKKVASAAPPVPPVPLKINNFRSAPVYDPDDKKSVRSAQAAHKPIATCRFVERGKVCPYGRSCLYSHAPVRTSAPRPARRAQG